MNVMWSVISAAAVLSIAALATAWAQSKIGAAGAATLAEKPQLATTVIRERDPVVLNNAWFLSVQIHTQFGLLFIGGLALAHVLRASW